jgi:outer membrane protein TolC
MHPQKLFNLALLCPVLFLGTANGQAQEKPARRLSLYEALALAEENNAEIIKSALDKEVAEEEVKETEELKLPELDFHTAYSRVSNITEFTHGNFGGSRVTHTTPEMYDMSVTGRMPLYQGNRINNLVKKAKLQGYSADLALQKTIKNIRLEVSAVFLGAYKLMELDKLLAENVAEEKERLKEVQALLKNGTVTKNEVLRAELQLSDRELSLLNNKKNLEIAIQELKTLLQLPEEEEITLDTLNLLQEPGEFNYSLLQNAALSNEEIKMAQQQEQMSRTDVAIAKANYYPSINLFGSYAYKYPNYMFFPPDPYAYTFGQVGVEAVFNISGLYKNKTRVGLAKKKADAANAQTKVVANKMQDKIVKQYKQYEEIRDSFAVTDKAEALAEENYRLVKLQYLNQLVVLTEMVDADNALLQAKYNKISVRIDAAMKYYEMLHTAGLTIQ